MQIDIRRPKIRSGELLVEVNGSGLRNGDEPYAEIVFTDGPGAAILVDGPADCDRIIRAAVDAKRKLMAAVIPHAFRDGEGKHWECRECGVHEGHHIDAPAPVITDGEPWTRAGVAAAIVPAPATVTEFTSDSRLVKTAACTQPEYHGAGLLGGKPNMPVLCDRPEHHEPASVTA